MVMNIEFWKNKKVFVTGHTGFKGSWLCLWLQHMEADVCGYALAPPTSPNNFTEAKVANGMASFIGDTRDYNTLLDQMQKFSPDIVIHLAAQPLVRESYINPRHTIETNVMGTTNVFEAIRHTPSVKSVVNVTTDKCYENREWAWGYREDEAMGGYDPYSASKGCSELITSAYRRSFFNSGIAIASARAGNVIGGGDWAADRIVPDALKGFGSNTPVEVRFPNAIRPWQHVLEPLSGYLTLAEELYTNGQKHATSYNFGPVDEDAKPVQWILDTMASTWGDGATWFHTNIEHPHEAHYLKLDISKAKAYLNWTPKWNLNIALEMTVQWHKSWLANNDMQKECISQINDYINQ
jgi:CDP-glucose 4,6-dehydratase|tara:strand:- start:179 stop:1234 length:1056 start_codon:yes stop_codon:yes gene_type:complete